MHLVTNFQKSPSVGGSLPPAFLYYQYWWPEVTWFGQSVIFQADFDEIELKKNSYDAISVTSSPLRHQNDVTKITSQNFFILGPSQSKFLATLVCLIIYFGDFCINIYSGEDVNKLRIEPIKNSHKKGIIWLFLHQNI